MKLTNFGAAGARTSRMAGALRGGQYDKPFSRAQIAKPMYSASNPSAGTEAAASALTGNPTNPQQPAGGGANAGSDQQAAAAAPPPGQYDLSADPVLQQVQASIERANADASASALRQREQTLEQYGDPSLAAVVLGAHDPFVKAAGQNQESTTALLKRGYDEGLWNLDNTMDPSLLFSGARIKGEGQLGQDYQDRRYAAAQGVQSALSGITDAYNNALEGNQNTEDAALADAYNRAVQNALTNPPASSDSSTTPTASSTSTPTSRPGGGAKKPNPRHPRKHKLAHAASHRGGRPARAA